MLERERIIEIVVAVAIVALMIGAMIVIGMNYGVNDSTLSQEGGEVLVGAIIGFIVLSLLAGIGLAFALKSPEPPSNTDDSEDAEASSTA